MRRVKSLFQIFIISLFLFNGFTSCALFENDVADFMEKYTETAAIEQHNFNVETYNDASNQLCIASDGDAEITLLMRNPKKFSLIPSVDFNNLASNYSRSVVAINQEDTFTVKLSLPQEFLIPVDEGKDITALINLHEPMSGRDFDRYTINLSCNTKPPLILNPTIMNKGNQVFVIAFDMPNEEEVAIRHKDLAFVEINGVSYPVQVTTETDSTSDTGHPDLQVARYTFTDPHFKRSNPGYSELGGKTFDHKPNNSVYFETDDPFKNGDKEYTIILRDKAGLTSEVKASTSISKLLKPVILDRDGAPIAEGGITTAPYDEDTEKGVITIIPPTEDHLGHPVSGTTVHYRVYEATGSGLIYTSGTTMTAKTIELPQNTYRVEAYATLSNYENSSTATVKFRFMNNVLFVRACTDSACYNGDGSEAAPYTTIQEALDDINNTTNRPNKASTFTIMVEGDFTTSTYDMSGTFGDYGTIILHDDYWTDKLIIKKNPRCLVTNLAKLKSITLENSLDSDFEVTIGDVTVTNSGGDGITHDSSNTLIIDGTEVTGCTTTTTTAGIKAKNGITRIKSGNIHTNSVGIDADLGSSLGTSTGIVYIEGGTIFNNTWGFMCSGSNFSEISGGTISQNGNGSTGAGVNVIDGNCLITGGAIINNHLGISVQNNSRLKLYGGRITSNSRSGIIIIDPSSNINIKNNPLVQDNTTNIPAVPSNLVLSTSGKAITIDGPLTSGAKIGVTTYSDDEPTAIGDTYTFANGFANSGSPSQFFTSDKGYSIVGGSDGSVSIAKSGSSGGTYTALDYTVNMTSPSIHVGLNTAKTVTIAVSGTRKESGGTPTDLYYNNADNKFYTDPAFTTKAAGDNTVSFAASLYDGATKVNDCTVTASSVEGSLLVAVPAIDYVGTYTLKITANFLGVIKEETAKYEVIDISSTLVDVDRVKADIASGGHVAVLGVLTQESFADIASAVNSASGAVYLDLSMTVGLTKLDENVFSQSSKLRELVLPEGLTTIDSSSLWCLYYLEKLHIPASCTTIEGSAFFLCSTDTGLDITLEEGNGTFDLIDGAIYTKDHKKLVRFANGSSTSSFTIPAFVEEIADYAFTGAKFQSISFEEGSNLKKIGQFAFDYCDNLYSVSNLPVTVENIGVAAWRYCKSLARIIYKGTLTDWNNIEKGGTGGGIGGLIGHTVTVRCEDGNSSF